ncbi:MAG TPA: hypothetical protein VEY91_00360 [Candidatus Limnocylindria bacterium]|nr:hypothetical protein [Candidatus Limnocylindria bacterium]
MSLQVRLVVVLALAIGAVSCAHAPRRPQGVPIESRPTPTQPPPEPDTVAARPKRTPATTPSSPRPAAAVETIMTPAARKRSLTRIVADTTSASRAVKRCLARTLLPDQESVVESTRSLLVQARAALKRDELWRAESMARKARQLASSLECP